MIADGAAQHRIAGFQGVENRLLRDRTFDFNSHFFADFGQRSQMKREQDADHGKPSIRKMSKSKMRIRIRKRIRSKIKRKIMSHDSGFPFSYSRVEFRLIKP